jgi:YCII-related domain-containing protein
MANYFIAYHGGNQPESPEAGVAHKAKWQAWVEGLGDAAVNPGTPLGKFSTVSASGVSADGGPHPMSGFSVVTADSLEAAIAIAQGCPFLELGGTIEVAEMMQM